jgi:hypothetical protein
VEREARGTFWKSLPRAPTIISDLNKLNNLNNLYSVL